MDTAKFIECFPFADNHAEITPTTYTCETANFRITYDYFFDRYRIDHKRFGHKSFSGLDLVETVELLVVLGEV